MVPHETLLWANNFNVLHTLTQISALQVNGSFIETSSENQPMLDIIGIRAYNGGPHFMPPHIGTYTPVPALRTNWNECQRLPSVMELRDFTDFNEANMSHFDIDGPGGEIVTEVHFSPTFSGLKLVTNRGRECCWANHGAHDWVVKKAAHGKVIVGISGCFGNLSGWSQGAKAYSHWKLSDVGIIEC